MAEQWTSTEMTEAPSVTLEIKPTTEKMRRHIVRREGPIHTPADVREKGPRFTPLTDSALCGASWDRANPKTGELCEACVSIYKRMHPTWPLPG